MEEVFTDKAAIDPERPPPVRPPPVKEKSTEDPEKVAGKFQFIKHIGSGSFGEIYSGIDLTTKEEIAIKVESIDVNHPQLHNEYLIYHNFLRNTVGFPTVSYYATTKKHNYFVMSLLGHNLEYLFDVCRRKFSVKTLLMISDQLIERVGNLHDKSGYLHRDIKPENLMFGRGKDKSVLYLVDLGLAKMFLDSTGAHIIPRKIRRSLTGTARYASINAHHGKDQSRRDDMESVGYVLIYLCRGRLPWQGIKASNKKERYEMICEKKMSSKPSELCFGLMQEFRLYLEYVRKLEFSEKPDYDLLRGMFQEESDYKALFLFMPQLRKSISLQAMERTNLSNDGQYDWLPLVN